MFRTAVELATIPFTVEGSVDESMMTLPRQPTATGKPATEPQFVDTGPGVEFGGLSKLATSRLPGPIDPENTDPSLRRNPNSGLICCAASSVYGNVGEFRNWAASCCFVSRYAGPAVRSNDSVWEISQRQLPNTR